MEILPLVLIAISVIAFLFTFILVVIVDIKAFRFKSKSKSTITPATESELEPTHKLPWLFIIILIVLIIISIVLIVLVLSIKQDKIVEEKMDDIINSTNTMIENARTQVNGISLTEIRRKTDSISTEIGTLAAKFGMACGLNEVLSKGNVFRETISDTIDEFKNFETTVSDVNANFPSSCGSNTDIDNTLRNRLSIIRRARDDKLRVSEKSAEAGLGVIKKQLRKEGENQKNLDAGKAKIEKHVKKMIEMLDHFKTDISKSESTKKKLQNKVVDSANIFDTKLITKIFVTTSSVIMIILSILVLIIIIKPKVLGQKSPSAGLLITINVTGVVILFTCLVAFLIGLGLIGTSKCEANFGLSNFITPLPNTTSLICAKRDSKFFADLGNGPILTSDMITKNLQVEDYKQKMLAIVTSLNITITVPPEFLQEIEVIENNVKKLDDLINRRCLNSTNQGHLEKYQKSLAKLLSESSQYQNSIATFNGHLRNTATVFQPLFDTAYKEIVESFETVITRIEKKIAGTDFACSLISTNYSEIGRSICKIFDVSMDLYYVVIMVMIICCLGALIIQIFALKKLTSVDGNIGLDCVLLCVILFAIYEYFQLIILYPR